MNLTVPAIIAGHKIRGLRCVEACAVQIQMNDSNKCHLQVTKYTLQ